LATSADEITSDAGLPEHVRIAVVGAGFAGIGAAVALRDAGYDDVVVLERAETIGGTWRDNTYPGCACDIRSHLYSFSFAANPGWTRSFPPQPEIWRYLQDVCDRFGVRRWVRCGVEVTQAAWDEGAARWRISTSSGDLTADVLIGAAGALSQPSVPALPGLADFTGAAFHSARWQHDVDLAGARVAVVGTGASAIQLVPRIQPLVEQLHVFQRTPPWVLPRRDRPIPPRRRGLYRSLPIAQRLARAAIYATCEAGVVGFVAAPAAMRAVEVIARRHLARQVADPTLRARLVPTYRAGCKRLLLSDDYYPALTQPNVELVPAGVQALTRDGLVSVDGRRRPVDVVIFGTGFEATNPPIAHRLRGRGGGLLADAWAAQGMQALRGTTVRGFPNLFLLVGPNTGLGHNSMILMIESQLRYVLDAMRAMDSGGLSTIEPTPSAQARWNATLQRRMRRTVWATGGCTSWYQDAQGRIPTLWPGSPGQFRRATRAIDLGEYDVTRASAPGAPNGAPADAPHAAAPAAGSPPGLGGHAS
jgi:cation diffusion facilitator CzcD-associated flavoprotein CzcO